MVICLAPFFTRYREKLSSLTFTWSELVFSPLKTCVKYSFIVPVILKKNFFK